MFGVQHEDERDRQISLHPRSLSFRHPMREESVEVTAPLNEAWQAPQLEDLAIHI